MTLSPAVHWGPCFCPWTAERWMAWKVSCPETHHASFDSRWFSLSRWFSPSCLQHLVVSQRWFPLEQVPVLPLKYGVKEMWFLAPLLLQPTDFPNGKKSLLRMYLSRRLCTLHLHACQVRVTISNSGLCCCTCVMYFEH